MGEERNDTKYIQTCFVVETISRLSCTHTVDTRCVALCVYVRGGFRFRNRIALLIEVQQDCLLFLTFLKGDTTLNVVLTILNDIFAFYTYF